MSEYQYYEFQAVDRPLNDKEMLVPYTKLSHILNPDSSQAS